MSAHRYRATWRSILFNGLYDDSGIVEVASHLNAAYRKSDYRLESLLWGPVETNDYREVRQFEEGGEANEAYEGVMRGIARGVIYGLTHADLEDRDLALREAFSVSSCRIDSVANDPPGLHPFDFKQASASSPGYLALRVYARPASGRPVVISQMREGLSRRFTISLVSFDPRQYSQDATSVSAATNGSTTILPVGNTYTLPRIVIVSAGSGHFVLTLNGAAVMEFTGLPAGTWTIDCARSTITKADGTNGMQYRTGGFISNGRLLAGSNTFVTTGSSALTSVTVVYRDAWA